MVPVSPAWRWVCVAAFNCPWVEVGSRFKFKPKKEHVSQRKDKRLGPDKCLSKGPFEQKGGNPRIGELLMSPLV